MEILSKNTWYALQFVLKSGPGGGVVLVGC